MVVNDQRKVDVSDTNFSTSRSLSFPRTVLTTTAATKLGASCALVTNIVRCSVLNRR
jgi:hypothetical protein